VSYFLIVSGSKNDRLFDNHFHRELELFLASNGVGHLNVCLFLVNEFKVKEVHEEGERNSDVNFGKGLPKTNTLTTHKRCMREGTPWAAISSLDPFATILCSAHVKACRLELIRFWPLVGISMNAFERNRELSTFFEHEGLALISELSVLSHRLLDRVGCGRL